MYGMDIELLKELMERQQQDYRKELQRVRDLEEQREKQKQEQDDDAKPEEKQAVSEQDYDAAQVEGQTEEEQDELGKQIEKALRHTYRFQTDLIVKNILAYLLGSRGHTWIQEWRPNYSYNHNPCTKTVYRGNNQLKLSVISTTFGFDDPRWTTPKEAERQGYIIREDAHPVVIAKWEMRISKSSLAKHPSCIDMWEVYNFSEMIGPEPYEPPPVLEYDSALEYAEKLKSSSRCPITWVTPVDSRFENNPYYDGVSDTIFMPDPNTFFSPCSYLRVLAHEMIHSTCLPLKRNLNDNSFEAYAFEEIVAEIGAALICSAGGFEEEWDPNSYNSHMAYIEEWLNGISEDSNNTILSAARKAQEAALYILERLEERESAVERSHVQQFAEVHSISGSKKEHEKAILYRASA